MKTFPNETKGFKPIKRDIFSVCDSRLSSQKHSAIVFIHTTFTDKFITSGLSKIIIDKYPNIMNNYSISTNRNLGNVVYLEIDKNHKNNNKLILANIICHKKPRRSIDNTRNFNYVAFAHGLLNIKNYISKLNNYGYDDIEIMMPIISAHNSGANWCFISEIFRDIDLNTNISFYIKDNNEH